MCNLFNSTRAKTFVTIIAMCVLLCVCLAPNVQAKTDINNVDHIELTAEAEEKTEDKQDSDKAKEDKDSQDDSAQDDSSQDKSDSKDDSSQSKDSLDESSESKSS